MNIVKGMSPFPPLPPLQDKLHLWENGVCSSVPLKAVVYRRNVTLKGRRAFTIRIYLNHEKYY